MNKDDVVVTKGRFLFITRCGEAGRTTIISKDILKVTCKRCLQAMKREELK